MSDVTPTTGTTPTTGVVLGGGGARGAYEVGVMAGLVKVLGLMPRDLAPFRVFAGTSVGAINATFLAANAHRGDMDIEKLVRLWQTLEIDRHLRVDVMGFLGLNAPRLPFRKKDTGPKARFGHHFLDPTRLEALVQDGIDWRILHENVRRNDVHALIVAALHVGTGRTTMFAELSPSADFRPSGDPRRVARMETITSDHVLGSAAIPMVFPARRVGMGYYCDGGIRFNTPIAPAIRAGAERLVVVSLLRQPVEGDVVPAAQPEVRRYPHPAFLIGKIMNALLLDPVAYDLYVLDRFNKLLEVLEDTHTPTQMARMNKMLVKERGISYRRIEHLVFTPSQDIGLLASAHLRESAQGGIAERLRYWALGFAGDTDATWEADLASYVLFDGRFAAKLIALGRRDVEARAEEVQTFFKNPPPKPS